MRVATFDDRGVVRCGKSEHRNSKQEDSMANTLTTGDRVPDLALSTLDGADTRLSDYLGNRLLLFFWGSW